MASPETRAATEAEASAAAGEKRRYIEELRQRAHREIDRAAAAAEHALSHHDSDAAYDALVAAREVVILANAIRSSIEAQQSRRV